MPEISEQRDIEMAKADARWEAIQSFAVESNRIERINDEASDTNHGWALRKFLALDRVMLVDVRAFVGQVAPKARFRDRRGRNVLIRLQNGDSYTPPLGGHHIVGRLEELLEEVNRGGLEPAEAHAAYEALHPFTDGNGRSGRALWAWQMERAGLDPFSLPFLHRFYYQSLELARRQIGAPG